MCVPVNQLPSVLHIVDSVKIPKMRIFDIATLLQMKNISHKEFQIM